MDPISLHRCRTFDRVADLCGKADSEANRNAYADSDPETFSNTNANCNPETFGHANASADSNPDPGCHSKSMSSSGGLWCQQLEPELARKPWPVEGDLPPPYAGSELDLHLFSVCRRVPTTRTLSTAIRRLTTRARSQATRDPAARKLIFRFREARRVR